MSTTTQTCNNAAQEIPAGILANKKVLLTSTSFMDNPGKHHDLLNSSQAIVVKERGPLSEEQLLKVITTQGPFDACILGDDLLTKKVIAACGSQLQVITKYGIGVDSFDLEGLKQSGIPLANTPGVNHSTVSEATFGLILSLMKNIPLQYNAAHRGEWLRPSGRELAQKTIGILGFGRIGKEVAKRAMSFGMKVLAYDTYWGEGNEKFVSALSSVYANDIFQEFPPCIKRVAEVDEILATSDILSLHMNLSDSNKAFLNESTLRKTKRGIYIVNTARGGLVNEADMARAVESGQVAGYGTDVISHEPIAKDNPLIGINNIVITCHTASRTPESVERQGSTAVQNILAYFSGQEPANWVIPPAKGCCCCQS